MKKILKKIIEEKKELSAREVKKVFSLFLSDKFSPAQAAAFLAALAVRGENAQELLAARTSLLQKARCFRPKVPGPLLDVCGTGGKLVKTLNISSLVSFVLAAGKVYVAKHGNHSFSSFCGSADIVKAWGINIEAKPAVMKKAIEQVGVGFLYAPLYHPAVKYVSSLRREIGVRTIFNLIGPLANPAYPSHQLLGVYKPDLCEKMALVLAQAGLNSAFVVFGEGLGDEVSLLGKTKVSSFSKAKKIKTFYLKPSDFGLKKVNLKDIKSQNLSQSLKLAENVLLAKESAALDMVLANAALAFVLAKKAYNLKAGVKKAYYLLKSGKVKLKMEELKNFLARYA